MSKPETRSVIVEREFPHAPEKLWRALTQPHLIQEWLMNNDFKPQVDHRFTLKGDWGQADCKVLEVEQNKTLSYTWDAMGLASVITFTLTRTSAGTHLRMEQAGFPMGYPQAFNGATMGWKRYLENLAKVLERDV